MAIQIIPISFDNNILTPQEQNLVDSKNMVRIFGVEGDFAQLFVYNNLGTLISSNPNFQNYSVTNNKQINFEPAFDIESLGFRTGTYRLQYNFLRPVLSLESGLNYFIKNISADRTEIKIGTVTDNEIFYTNAVGYINVIQNRNYFIEFYLDFGNNNLITALSLAAETDIFGNATVTVKLENPLPNNLTINTPLNVIEKVVNTQQFEAVLTPDVVSAPPAIPTLRQANFSIDVDSYRIGSSDYYNYNQILNLTQSNELQTLLSFISSSNPTLNIDYTDYNNFIHFGSAVTQLETFHYKLNQIQTYEGLISSLPPNDLNYILYNNNINDLIQNFTDYENYLYYESSSYSWPKYNSTKPYLNYSTTASQAITWYNFQQTSASYYDEFNNNNLVYALPQYLQESPTFPNVSPFVNSMGQLFDDIWLYIKAITDLWKADNALQDGISKDLVVNALQSLGIPIYTDGDQDDIYTWLYGTDQSGSPYFQTSSFQTAVTASQYTLSGQDEAKSIFKRIYHNLPTLLKSKGSNKFINYLNTLYGTPETILFPMEFGGVDKTDKTTEYIYDKFTYGLQQDPNKYSFLNRINTGSYGFNSLEFRFNPITQSNQTLLSGIYYDSIGGSNIIKWGITLEPIQSGSYNYGRVKFINYDVTPATYLTCSVDLPIFVTGSDGKYDWWNITITQPNSTGYYLSVGNEINGEVGHYASVFLPTTDPIDKTNYYIQLGTIPTITPYGNPVTLNLLFYQNCYSQIQEFRGWTETPNQETINTHILDPGSYMGNSVSSSYNNLLFRFPLGNDLNIYNHSVQQTITGSQPLLNSNYFLQFNGPWTENDYKSFTETYYTQPAIGGYSVPVTNKIRIQTDTLASHILRPDKSVVYNNPTGSRTLDTNLTQTGFSPQDQINNDIISQLGDTYNLDDIIGDPRLYSSNNYPQLDKLREEYFKKYIDSYNYKDFVQLIDTYQKSLFRYITNSIPGRSVEATGIVVKPHILERPKVSQFNPTIDTSSYEGTIDTAFISAGNGGDYCCSRNSPINEAFYDGEFQGSDIDVNEYITSSPFVKGFCACRRYEVTAQGSTIAYNRCSDAQTGNGNVGIEDFGVTTNTRIINACSNEFIALFGTVYAVKDLGAWEDNQPYVEQYGGWDALNNNVSSSLISQYKFKKLKTSESINTTAYNCIRWKVTRNPLTAINQDMFVNYMDCNGTFSCLTLSVPGPGFNKEVYGYVNAREDGPPQWSNPAIPIAPCFNNTNTPIDFFTASFDGYVTLRDKREFTYFSRSAEFQDSYLTDTSFVRSRYTGVKTTSPDFNLTTFGNVIPNNKSNIGELSNAEQEVTYMAFSDWSGNSLAEKYGSSNYHIKFLIDESGSVFKPQYSSSYFWNTDQAFGADSIVNIAIYDGTNGSIGQDYETTIYRPLKRFETIIYSSTGSLGTNVLQGGFNTTMSFGIPPTSYSPDTNVRLTNSYTPERSQLVQFNTTIQDDSLSWNSATKTWIATETFSNSVNISSKVIIENKYTGLGSRTATFDVILYKNGIILANEEQAIPKNSNYTFTLSKNNVSISQGDEIYVRITLTGGNIDLAGYPIYILPALAGNNTELIIQDSGIPMNADVPSPYFTVGASSRNVLTASLKLTDYYGPGFIQSNAFNNTPKNQSLSGFSLSSSFQIKPYDQIRFMSNENQVYTIMSTDILYTYTFGVISDSQICFILDREIQTGTNINDFSIRRLVDDPGFIIINNDPLNVSQTGKAPSFIIPKYASETLKKNLDNIIQNLYQKNLI